MKKKLFFMLSICLLGVVAMGFGQDSAKKQLSESNYRVFSVKQNKVVALDDIVKEMQNYDIVFFGEEHNDVVGHYLELLLLKKLYDTYKDSLAFALEMFDRDRQIVLDEYLHGLIQEKYFKEKDGDYRFMIEFSKEKKLDVIASNAPSRYTNLVSRKGPNILQSLSPAAKTFIAPLPYDTATGAYYEKLRERMNTMNAIGSDTTKPPPHAFAMGYFNTYGQSLWDATMAYSIAQYHTKYPKRKIMHVNGKFHSDEYFGIVGQLEKYKLKKRSLVISAFSEKSFPTTNYSEYKKVADYIIITDPSVPKNNF